MSVRKVSNRGGNIIGHVPSLKLGRLVMFESLLERDLIYQLDYEWAVEHFAEQPLRIAYQHAGRARHYTPDFHVVISGYNLLVECKPVHFVDDPENQIKFAAARAWCQAHDWLFRVVTDAHLATWRVKNIRWLTQFARYEIAPEIREHILTWLAAAPAPVKVADVMQAINPQIPQTVIIPILHLAFHHAVDISLDDAPITVDSPIGLANHSDACRGSLL
jgi:hypothetical protein